MNHRVMLLFAGLADSGASCSDPEKPAPGNLETVRFTAPKLDD